jgi:hypothetical protein
MGSCIWLFLEFKARSICEFYSLMIWTTALFAHPLTLMLFKFSRRWNLREPSQSPQISPGDNVESGVGSIDPSDATLVKELPCPDDYVDAPEDQIDCVFSLDHDAVEIFDPCPDEIPLNVQIMSWALEDQQVLRFNCLGDIVAQSYISGPSVSVAMLLCRVLQTCSSKFVSVTDERLPFRMKQQSMNSLFETLILLSRVLVIYRVYRQCRISRSL